MNFGTFMDHSACHTYLDPSWIISGTPVGQVFWFYVTEVTTPTTVNERQTGSDLSALRWPDTAPQRERDPPSPDVLSRRRQRKNGAGEPTSPNHMNQGLARPTTADEFNGFPSPKNSPEHKGAR